MHKMKEPKYVAETLKWCNERRKEKGKKPLKRLPKGERFDGNSCPCGQAAGIWVGALTWGPGRGKVPNPVGDFIYAFDSGHLPQYEQCTK